MSVELAGLRLPLAPFTLEADASLGGRVTAIFGSSGAGKTSLLELVAGLRRPVAGRIVVDEVILTDAGARVFVPPHRRAIGYVPQEGALFPHLSVQQNLQYGCRPDGNRPAGLTLEHVSEILEIAPLLARDIATLSGGEKQRVALGRALLASPRLLLLDEPLAGLDVPLRERLVPYLARVRDEFAVPMIYVTHSPDEIMALCDDVLVLHQGRIAQRGRPRDLFTPTAAPRYELKSKT